MVANCPRSISNRKLTGIRAINTLRVSPTLPIGVVKLDDLIVGNWTMLVRHHPADWPFEDRATILLLVRRSVEIDASCPVARSAGCQYILAIGSSGPLTTLKWRFPAEVSAGHCEVAEIAWRLQLQVLYPEQRGPCQGQACRPMPSQSRRPSTQETCARAQWVDL